MRTRGSHFLKRLDPPVRPDGTPGPIAPRQAPLHQRSFDELLSLVSSGQLRTGRPIDIRIALDDELSSGQMDRLSAAADDAEIAGARQALMLLDGRGLVLDVDDRAIHSELREGATLVDVDAAVFVSDPDSTHHTTPPSRLMDHLQNLASHPRVAPGDVARADD